MSNNNGGKGHGQFPNYNNNSQGVPNTIKRKIPPAFIEAVSSAAATTSTAAELRKVARTSDCGTSYVQPEPRAARTEYRTAPADDVPRARARTAAKRAAAECTRPARATAAAAEDASAGDGRTTKVYQLRERYYRTIWAGFPPGKASAEVVVSNDAVHTTSSTARPTRTRLRCSSNRTRTARYGSLGL